MSRGILIQVSVLNSALSTPAIIGLRSPTKKPISLETIFNQVSSRNYSVS